MKKLSSPANGTGVTPGEEDKTLDLTLRPKNWESYIGQEKVKKNIKVIIEAAQKRAEPIEHLLFYGGS